MKPKILLTREVADILRVGEDHVRNLIRTGKLKAYKEGRRGGFRIESHDVDEYVNKKLGEF